MKLKKVKGTHRHSFDVTYIQKLIEKDMLDENDAKRILAESLHVISGLRGIVEELRAATFRANQIGKDSIWMNLKK